MSWLLLARHAHGGRPLYRDAAGRWLDEVRRAEAQRFPTREAAEALARQYRADAERRLSCWWGYEVEREGADQTHQK